MSNREPGGSTPPGFVIPRDSLDNQSQHAQAEEQVLTVIWDHHLRLDFLYTQVMRGEDRTNPNYLPQEGVSLAFLLAQGSDQQYFTDPGYVGSKLFRFALF